MARRINPLMTAADAVSVRRSSDFLSRAVARPVDYGFVGGVGVAFGVAGLTGAVDVFIG